MTAQNLPETKDTRSIARRVTAAALGLLFVYAMAGAGCAGGTADAAGAATGAPAPADTRGSGSGDHSVSLAWDPVLKNEDGTDLTDLAGYRVYDGQNPGVYTMVTEAGANTAVTIDSLVSGTYYFAVTAYDWSGNESTFSNEVAVTVGSVASSID